MKINWKPSSLAIAFFISIQPIAIAQNMQLIQRSIRDGITTSIYFLPSTIVRREGFWVTSTIFSIRSNRRLGTLRTYSISCMDGTLRVINERTMRLPTRNYERVLFSLVCER